MKIGIESRKGAAQRMGKENIDDLFAKIDEDRAKNPELYGGKSEDPQLNSGMTNGETPIEQVRKEMTGSNGMSNS